MTTRLSIAFALIALVVLALVVLAGRASLHRRRRRRPSRQHLRVDLFAADRGRSAGQGANRAR